MYVVDDDLSGKDLDRYPKNIIIENIILIACVKVFWGNCMTIRQCGRFLAKSLFSLETENKRFRFFSTSHGWMFILNNSSLEYSAGLLFSHKKLMVLLSVCN